MNLPNPIPGSSGGPQYALDLQSCLNVIDQHNHSAGSGQQIQPNGLNINGDLSFQSNNAYALRSTRFTPQVSPIANAGLDVGILYVSGNELYYNDVTGGHQVPITLNGNVNATSSGISSGAASAAFVGGVLEVKSSSTNGANIKIQNLILTNNADYTNTLTLQAPNLAGGSIAETLPPIPLVTSFMTMDSSGNMATSVALLGALTTANLSTAANIVGTQLSASAAILGSQLSATAGILGSQLSASANITGSQLSASANIIGTQLSSTANILPSQLGPAHANKNSASGSTCLNSTSSIPVTLTGTGKPVLLSITIYGNNEINVITGVDTMRSIRLKVNGSTLYTLNVGDNSNTYTIPITGTFLDPTGGVGSLTYDVLTDAGTAGPPVGTIELIATEL